MPTATMQEIDDLRGLLTCLTGAGKSGNAALLLIGMPTLKPYIGQLEGIVAEQERLARVRAAAEDDGA